MLRVLIHFIPKKNNRIKNWKMQLTQLRSHLINKLPIIFFLKFAICNPTIAFPVFRNEFNYYYVLLLPLPHWWWWWWVEIPGDLTHWQYFWAVSINFFPLHSPFRPMEWRKYAEYLCVDDTIHGHGNGKQERLPIDWKLFPLQDGLINIFHCWMDFIEF